MRSRQSFEKPRKVDDSEEDRHRIVVSLVAMECGDSESKTGIMKTIRTMISLK